MSLKPKELDFDKTWRRLKETVSDVIKLHNVKRMTWNDRFSDVYFICVAIPDNYSDRLYDETKEFLEFHVKELHQNVLSNEDRLLQCYEENWSKYSQGATYMDFLYRYLNEHLRKLSEADRNFGAFPFELLDEQRMDIGELALDIWKKHMIKPMKKNLQQLLLTEIQRDRRGEGTTNNMLHSVINSLVEVERYKSKNQLKLYQDVFEIQFLEETGKHYKQEASYLLEILNCSQYMERVLQYLQEENLRSHKFLHHTSYAKVQHECGQRMVADLLGFLNTECHQMVGEERLEDLSRMYQLLKSVPDGIKHMTKELEDHIKETGLGQLRGLKEENMPMQFVEAVLSLHQKYSEMIKGTFAGDSAFEKSLDKACASVVNHRIQGKLPCRSPELLAKYCDSFLKKSSKGTTESELEDKLDQCILVFRYLDDKDVFQRFYARMLARRLIHAAYTSMYAEESMINKLKKACGYEFTVKLHRMYMDMGVCEDLNSKFSDFLTKQNVELGINFFINVLTTGSWPFGPPKTPSTFALPQELEKSVQMFEGYYKDKFPGRRLTWLHHLATAELKLSHLKKSYIVTVSTFQMGILLLFNTEDSLPFSDIQTCTQINDKECARNIQSLVDVKLIEQEPEGNIVPNTILRLNFNYSNKRTKFKISAAIQKETPQEVEQTHVAVEEDRKLYLQAAIVRIMKARKKLKHNILIQEVISQAMARFAPSVSMIKKCIEALIDKQYIERTGATDEYAYVA
ncbi:cullin-2-like [Apostichopus japonicus]|uniref:cullin-2-like n=1 Tax=Stichopus japonicus TaxID=307972 RepID=UPI003AB8B1AF